LWIAEDVGRSGARERGNSEERLQVLCITVRNTNDAIGNDVRCYLKSSQRKIAWVLNPVRQRGMPEQIYINSGVHIYSDFFKKNT
jgi:hypothetical protein